VGRNLRDHIFAPIIALPREESDCFGFRLSLKYSSGRGFRNDHFVCSSYIEAASMNWDFESDAPAGVMLCALAGKLESVGWLEVVSNDPKVSPEIHMNFLDESTSDMDQFKQVARMALELAETAPLDAELTLQNPTPEVAASDAELEKWLAENVATGYHGAGTCRMGPADDEGAVVSQRLAVHGTEGLYVADASVMPNITTAFTNITCYMIGERLADWLKA
jgi:choline dehydrogenase